MAMAWKSAAMMTRSTIARAAAAMVGRRCPPAAARRADVAGFDVVELHDRTSHFYSGFVSLGEFVPYKRAKGE